MLKKMFALSLCCALLLLLAVPVAAAKTDSVPPVVVSWLGSLPKMPETAKDWPPVFEERPYKLGEEITFVMQLLVLPTGFENALLQVWSGELNLRQSKPVLLQLDGDDIKSTPLTGVTRTKDGFHMTLNSKNITFSPTSVYYIAFTARNTRTHDGVVYASVSGGKPASLDQDDAVILLRDQYLRIHKQAVTEPVDGLEGTQVASYMLSYMDGVEIIRIIVGEDNDILGFAKLIGKKVLPVNYNLTRKRYVTSDGRDVIRTKELQSIFTDLSISFLKPFSEADLLAMSGYQNQSAFPFHSNHEKAVSSPSDLPKKGDAAK